ncbi:STAS domain-containing protein [Paenibacillus alginolyticus]|uniref:STAS domain-containing protein n=1 Tax=Paenibacillus alginolyticus TaxID=59839 RepID=UPI0003FF0DA8|nr:STAS domain-containing protein [Paenibacillus alginolyticus]MCY9667044.1 STAS domain-containing protein [Paenibacillus alginolyticus]
MFLDVRMFDGQVNVTPRGKIYVDEATIIREKLFPYLDKGCKQFVFHLCHVDYIDSSGLGVLVALQKKAHPSGGGVVIQGLQGDVKELFELTRLTSVFEIYP